MKLNAKVLDTVGDNCRHSCCGFRRDADVQREGAGGVGASGSGERPTIMAAHQQRGRPFQPQQLRFWLSQRWFQDTGRRIPMTSDGYGYGGNSYKATMTPTDGWGRAKVTWATMSGKARPPRLMLISLAGRYFHLKMSYGLGNCVLSPVRH